MQTEPLFVGIYPAGIVYADRRKEEHGDYKCIAFLSFDTLELTIYDKKSDLLPAIRTDAALLQARRGEEYRVSTCGQTVLLGSKAF